MLKKLLPLLLSIFIMVGNMPGFTVHAYGNAQVYDVALPGIYHQSEARSMLSKINALRKNNAWAYGKVDLSSWSEDSRKDFKNLPQVKYDYKLEQYAMKRAAEIAFVYDHKRPGSTGWGNDSLDELMRDNPSLNVSSENLYLGNGVDADTAFNAWLEEDCTYEGQGHRRNMLGVGSNMNPNGTVAVGIACFSHNGCNYWVQVFADKVLDPVAKQANDAEATVDLKLSAHNINGLRISTMSGGIRDIQRNSITDQIIVDVAETETIEVSPGETVPDLCELFVSTAFCASGYYYSVRFPLKNKINIENSKVVAMKSGKLKAVGTGKTKISSISRITGKEIIAYITVSAKDLGSCGSYEINGGASYTYTGKAVTPKVTIKENRELPSGRYKSVVLKEGTDYQLSYKNNTGIGTATVIATGIGKYCGTLVGYFEISKARLDLIEINGGTTFKYTGKIIKPKVTVKQIVRQSSGKVDQIVLKEGRDYKLSYLSNVSPGAATIVATGTGKYTGTLTAYFKIVKDNAKKTRLAKGKIFKNGGITYKVLTSTSKKGTVVVYKSESKLGSVKIPSSVKDKNGFSYSVTTIGKSAFKGNKSLTSITINGGISKIESNAFENCKKLKAITIYDYKISIGKNAFKGIASKAKITVKTGNKTKKKAILKTINKNGGAKNTILK